MMTTYTPSSGKILFQQLEDLEKNAKFDKWPIKYYCNFFI